MAKQPHYTITMHPTIAFPASGARAAALELEARAAALMEAHRRGEHPYGSMRRDCPLCQAGRPST